MYIYIYIYMYIIIKREERESCVNFQILIYLCRTDFMKLNVTYIITLMERGFNRDQPSYTDADLSDLNTLGEDCKRSLQAMPCQVFEPCDAAIYKELKAEENLQKVL